MTLRELLTHFSEEHVCDECGHTAKLHSDGGLCEHERGDVEIEGYGSFAEPPCGCAGDPVVVAIAEQLTKGDVA